MMMVVYSLFLVTLCFSIGLVSISSINVVDVLEFQLAEVPPGSELCALDTPSYSLSLNSVLECALECQRSLYCENFNYKNINKTCDIFFDRPTCYGPSPFCIHYQVII